MLHRKKLKIQQTSNPRYSDVVWANTLKLLNYIEKIKEKWFKELQTW